MSKFFIFVLIAKFFYKKEIII